MATSLHCIVFVRRRFDIRYFGLRESQCAVKITKKDSLSVHREGNGPLRRLSVSMLFLVHQCQRSPANKDESRLRTLQQSAVIRIIKLYLSFHVVRKICLS